MLEAQLGNHTGAACSLVLRAALCNVAVVAPDSVAAQLNLVQVVRSVSIQNLRQFSGVRSCEAQRSFQSSNVIGRDVRRPRSPEAQSVRYASTSRRAIELHLPSESRNVGEVDDFLAN